MNVDVTLDLWVEDNMATVAADCCQGTASTASSAGTVGCAGSTVSTGGCAGCGGSASTKC
ncbi:hypothetical protein AB5J62_12875 [Amycolatopsis sp. cg5]|uniref:hypothetical protein n=1 Tax=Amycolatopsis sp. cg5 TaxID=3238802 RepID=UPI003524E080